MEGAPSTPRGDHIRDHRPWDVIGSVMWVIVTIATIITAAITVNTIGDTVIGAYLYLTGP